MNRNEVALQFTTHFVVSTPVDCQSASKFMYTLNDGKHTPHRTCRKPSPKLATSLRCCLGSCFWRHWAAPRISLNFGGKDFPAGSESYSMCRMSLPSALIIYTQFLEDRLYCGVQSTVNHAQKSLICDAEILLPVYCTQFNSALTNEKQSREGKTFVKCQQQFIRIFATNQTNGRWIQCCCVWTVESL